MSCPCLVIPLLLVCVGLLVSVRAAAVTPPCGSVYKGFAQCLLLLGDKLSSNTQTQDIRSVCRSWDEFQVCVNEVLSGCRGDAAQVWESLKAESRQGQFSGNLYETCSNQSTATSIPQSLPSTDQTNQESLKGHAPKKNPSPFVRLLPSCICSLLLLRV
ncbi:neuritin-like protein [Denticeps clupeoides]|uniref:neuritin-like protein n=1 Tax=Denticeps clupeoides TaxID=299321 RepID=UPI0010A4E858|nr:neuritin-like protein [Denticeps clupeoides]